MNEGQWLWDHFKFNAEQRLKGFNFFVLLSIFSDGGVFTAIEKNTSPLVLMVLGVFIMVLSSVFWIIDTRSQQLLLLATPGMKEFEKQFAEKSRLFAMDSVRTSRFIRYTFAFRTLFVCQLLFGAGVALYGLSQSI